MDGKRFSGTIGTFWPTVAKHYGFTARGNLTVNQAIDDLCHGKLMIAGMNPPYFKNHNKKYPISQIFKEKSTNPDDKLAGGPIFTIG